MTAPDERVDHIAVGQPPARRRPARRAAQGSFLRETVIIVVSAWCSRCWSRPSSCRRSSSPARRWRTRSSRATASWSQARPGPFDVDRGDIVVFMDPGGWLAGHPGARAASSSGVTACSPSSGCSRGPGQHLVKRVIGLPGDHVVCCDAAGQVTVNGRPSTSRTSRPGAAPSDTVRRRRARGPPLGDGRQPAALERLPVQRRQPGGGFGPDRQRGGHGLRQGLAARPPRPAAQPDATFADVPDAVTRDTSGRRSRRPAAASACCCGRCTARRGHGRGRSRCAGRPGERRRRRRRRATRARPAGFADSKLLPPAARDAAAARASALGGGRRRRARERRPRSTRSASSPRCGWPGTRALAAVARSAGRSTSSLLDG